MADKGLIREPSLLSLWLDWEAPLCPEFFFADVAASGDEVEAFTLLSEG